MQQFAWLFSFCSDHVFFFYWTGIIFIFEPITSCFTAALSARISEDRATSNWVPVRCLFLTHYCFFHHPPITFPKPLSPRLYKRRSTFTNIWCYKTFWFSACHSLPNISWNSVCKTVGREACRFNISLHPELTRAPTVLLSQVSVYLYHFFKNKSTTVGLTRYFGFFELETPYSIGWNIKMNRIYKPLNDIFLVDFMVIQLLEILIRRHIRFTLDFVYGLRTRGACFRNSYFWTVRPMYNCFLAVLQIYFLKQQSPLIHIQEFHVVALYITSLTIFVLHREF